MDGDGGGFGEDEGFACGFGGVETRFGGGRGCGVSFFFYLFQFWWECRANVWQDGAVCGWGCVGGC